MRLYAGSNLHLGNTHYRVSTHFGIRGISLSPRPLVGNPSKPIINTMPDRSLYNCRKNGCPALNFVKVCCLSLLVSIIMISSGKYATSSEQHHAAEKEPERSARFVTIEQRKIAVMESLGGGVLTKGNKVTLLLNGPATYTAMFKAIQNAKESINLEFFSIDDNEMGHRLADLLLAKQSEGVRVNLMYDSAGSFHAPAAFFERMREGGIKVLEYNPLNPFKARGSWRPLRRDHRKVLIVDGKVVITGGMNFTQDYSTSPFSGEEDRKKARMPWRDTDVQIEGPVIAEFQRLFLDTWKRQKGPELPENDYFPRLNHRGKALVCLLGSFPGPTERVMYTMYVSAVNSAEKSIHLTHTFFLPDEQMLNVLINAAARNVDVKVVLPAFSDNPAIYYAERYYYSTLLKSGIQLYELHNAILHSKTAVIDGVWSTIGSTNVDYWSFFYNDEDNAVILNRQFAFKMEDAFAGDLRGSNEIKLAEWEKRPLSHKLKEWLAHLIARWL